MQFNWTCPHCNHPQIVTDNNYTRRWSYISVGKINIGNTGFSYEAIGCLNDACNKLTLSASLTERVTKNSEWQEGEDLRQWRLIPESSAIAQPDYIPAPLKDDYYQACRIRELSPKASATLSRRCLQGMIRDFAKIAKATLDAEIKELRKALDDGVAPAGVTLESVEAIDQVRSIGNIGAHMEKDINHIIDVDEGEAEALTDLIELLFQEWYVARHTRQQRLASLAAIAAQKKAAIAEARAAAAAKKAAEEE